MDVRSTSKVIGARARQIRTAAQVSQEQLAAEARKLGKPWTSSRIQKIESGENSLTVESMLILAMALSRVSDEPLTLATLIDDSDNSGKPDEPNGLAHLPDEYLSLPKGSMIDKKDVAGWFRGAPVVPIQWQQAGSNDWSKAMTIAGLAIAGRTDRSKHLSENEISALVQEIVAASGLAETRAAEALHTRLGAVALHSVALWGQGLVAERDERAQKWERETGKVANAQKRGQITRDLIAELRESLPDLTDEGDL